MCSVRSSIRRGRLTSSYNYRDDSTLPYVDIEVKTASFWVKFAAPKPGHFSIHSTQVTPVRSPPFTPTRLRRRSIALPIWSCGAIPNTHFLIVGEHRLRQVRRSLSPDTLPGGRARPHRHRARSGVRVCPSVLFPGPRRHLFNPWTRDAHIGARRRSCGGRRSRRRWPFRSWSRADIR